jgi:hypothetical protein
MKLTLDIQSCLECNHEIMLMYFVDVEPVVL